MFASECNGNRFDDGVFSSNVHDGAQGLCCESDTHRYCMTLDSDKPTCCEGINPATSDLTASRDATKVSTFALLSILVSHTCSCNLAGLRPKGVH
jgi:hypothetical protein